MPYRAATAARYTVIVLISIVKPCAGVDEMRNVADPAIAVVERLRGTRTPESLSAHRLANNPARWSLLPHSPSPPICTPFTVESLVAGDIIGILTCAKISHPGLL